MLNVEFLLLNYVAFNKEARGDCEVALGYRAEALYGSSRSTAQKE